MGEITDCIFYRTLSIKTQSIVNTDYNSLFSDSLCTVERYFCLVEKYEMGGGRVGQQKSLYIEISLFSFFSLSLSHFFIFYSSLGCIGLFLRTYCLVQTFFHHMW